MPHTTLTAELVVPLVVAVVLIAGACWIASHYR